MVASGATAGKHPTHNTTASPPPFLRKIPPPTAAELKSQRMGVAGETLLPLALHSLQATLPSPPARGPLSPSSHLLCLCLSPSEFFCFSNFTKHTLPHLKRCTAHRCPRSRFHPTPALPPISKAPPNLNAYPPRPPWGKRGGHRPTHAKNTHIST